MLPAKASNYNDIGTIKARLGDYIGALNSFEKASELDPNNHGYLQNIGNAMLNLNDVYGAINYFTKSIEINPSVNAYSLRAFAKYKLNDFQGACQDALFSNQLGGGDLSMNRDLIKLLKCN